MSTQYNQSPCLCFWFQILVTAQTLQWSVYSSTLEWSVYFPLPGYRYYDKYLQVPSYILDLVPDFLLQRRQPLLQSMDSGMRICSDMGWKWEIMTFHCSSWPQPSPCQLLTLSDYTNTLRPPCLFVIRRIPWSVPATMTPLFINWLGLS